jgi:oligosaccharide translocation protein RFT1
MAEQPPPPPSTKSSPTSTSTPTTPPSLVSASLSGAKFLILLQVFSRLLTFLVNQLLLRYLSPTLLGISVQLDLLNSSILYFSRESLRNALQRQPSTASQPIINLSLLTLPLGLVFSLILSISYARTSDAEAQALPYFITSVGLYVFATLVELLSEPAFAIVQQKMLYKIRATAESAASAARVVVTCGATILAAQRGLAFGPLGFALGQAAYAVVLLGVYVWKTGRAEPGFSMVPQGLQGKR